MFPVTASNNAPGKVIFLEASSPRFTNYSPRLRSYEFMAEQIRIGSPLDKFHCRKRNPVTLSLQERNDMRLVYQFSVVQKMRERH